VIQHQRKKEKTHIQQTALSAAAAMKVRIMKMMIQLVLSVNGYGDCTRREGMRCGLLVIYVMPMSAQNALQKGLMRTMKFIAILVQLGTFERVGNDIFYWLMCCFVVLFEE